MIEFLKWWLLFVFIGWISFPICYQIFKNFKTKGYGLSKIMAILLWGYIYWVGNVFSLISNSKSGALFSISLLFILSLVIVFFNNNGKTIINWIKDQRMLVIFFESLFLVAILIMLLVRGASPEILGTEKPMELAFINGIIRSDNFPPNDPWLSGHSISYYYFGYLIIAIIVKIIGTPTGIAFNLSLIFWFGLIAIAASDLLINLTSKNRATNENRSFGIRWKIPFASLLAPFFILITSNSEGLLELLHSLGIFWRRSDNGQASSRFWAWLDIKELVAPPVLPYDWNIHRPGGTWWWRASRVLQDYTLYGQSREIIDEFPFFSFFLGDLHPHLLAIPFVLLCISLAYMLFLEKYEASENLWVHTATIWKNLLSWLTALIVGSLIFFNTWDFPIYFGLIGVMIILRSLDNYSDFWKKMKFSFLQIISLGIMSLLLYAPFLIGFSSQAGGILPSLIFQSRSIHLIVMFLPLSLPIMLYIFALVIPALNIKRLLRTSGITVAIYFVGIAISILYVLLNGSIPGIIQAVAKITGLNFSVEELKSTQNLTSFFTIYGASDSQELILGMLHNLLSDPWDILILLFAIAIGVTVSLSTSALRENNRKLKLRKEDAFWGVLLVIAAVLVLFPELFYLRDQFGWRMNTIFKFYYQAWILFAICAAYAILKLNKISKGWIKFPILLVISITTITGLIYPFYTLKERFASIRRNGIELDGNTYLSTSNPDEVAAVEFLQSKECGVIAESVGGSYSNYGRVSKLTGCPAVLGWPGHEVQWRGGGELLGSRQVDIETLFSTKDWLTAREILEMYKIEYVFIGDLERSTYQVSEEKFISHLIETYSNNSVVIYRWNSHD